jgi:hypothetical protein
MGPSVRLQFLGAGRMAHFHIPKPLHGWREFAGEVGIIVLGVLIALGFEQLVQSLHQRLIANQAREAIRAEVRENLWWLEFRAGQEPCIDSTLSQLETVLTHARNGQATPRIMKVDLAVPSKITSLRWDANAEAGRASLFSGDEQRILGNIYQTTAQFRISQEEEQTAWARIGFVEGLDHFTPLDVHDLSVLLAEARYRNGRAKLLIERAHQWASRLQLTASNPNSVENLKLSSPPVCSSAAESSPQR